jgi:hypothetical protein
MTSVFLNETQTRFHHTDLKFACRRDGRESHLLPLSKISCSGILLSIATKVIEDLRHDGGCLLGTTHVSDPLPGAVDFEVPDRKMRRIGRCAASLGAHIERGLGTVDGRFDCIGNVRVSRACTRRGQTP